MNVDKLILMIIWRGKKKKIANTLLKKNKVRRLILANIETYYKAKVTKTMWYGQDIEEI